MTTYLVETYHDRGLTEGVGSRSTLMEWTAHDQSVSKANHGDTHQDDAEPRMTLTRRGWLAATATAAGGAGAWPDPRPRSSGHAGGDATPRRP